MAARRLNGEDGDPTTALFTLDMFCVDWLTINSVSALVLSKTRPVIARWRKGG